MILIDINGNTPINVVFDNIVVVAVVGVSSRKVPVLGQFTIHMVEIIQLYTDQPRMWLGFRHHPSSSVFQPYIWLGYSLNDEIRRNEPHFLGHFIKIQ